MECENKSDDRYDPNKKGERRIGMLAGKAKFPDDINKYDDEVMRLFGFSEEEIAEEMKGWQRSSN